MKVATILLNLANRIIKVFSDSKSYTDSAITPIDTRLTTVETFGTIVGNVQKHGLNQTITIPDKSTWRYMLVTAYAVVSDRNIVYQTVIFSTQSFALATYFLGGYYVSSTDRGLCNVNLYMPDNGEGSISLRNFLYANSSYGSSAYLQVRFFK